MNALKIIALVLGAVYVVGGIALFLFQDRLIFLPDTLDEDYVYKFEADFEELNLTMEDGAMINMLHFKNEAPKGLIVYFHGNAGNLARWGEIVLPFVKKGFDVLITDYRGYGKSTGSRSDKKLLSDAEEIYNYARAIYEEPEIILFGRSLGSTFASYLAGKYQPKKVILETPFYSLKDVAGGVIPIYPATYLLRYQFRSFEYLQSARSPIFIFHGTDDEIVPYYSGLKLYESANNASMYTIEEGHHNDLASFDSYWTAMDEVLGNE